MLELLAGPFPVTVAGEPAFYFPIPPFWHDAVGLVGTIQLADLSYPGCVVQIDGVGSIRCTAGVGSMGANIASGGLSTRFGNNFYEQCDLRVFQPRGDVLDLDGFGDFPLSATVLADRYIYARAGNLYAWANGGAVVEAALVDWHIASGDGVITPSRRGNEVFVCFAEGTIVPYNYALREVSGPVRYIEPCLYCFFSARLGVFVAVHWDDDAYVVKIWADEVRPAVVSEPELVAAPTKGAVITARAQVLGDQDEACAGVTVAWSSSLGAIIDERTATDAAGYAETRIALPVETDEEEVEIEAVVTL